MEGEVDGKVKRQGEILFLGPFWVGMVVGLGRGGKGRTLTDQSEDENDEVVLT